MKSIHKARQVPRASAAAVVGALVASLANPMPAAESEPPRQVLVVANDAELDAALAGNPSHRTIRLRPGNYRPGRSVDGAVRLTIEAAEPAQPPVFRGGNQAWHFRNGSHLTLRHLHCTGQRFNGINIDDGGSCDTPARHVLLENLVVSEVGPQGNYDGIKCSGVDDLVIRDCVISGWGGQAIDLVGCRRVLISGCRIAGKQGFSQATGPQFKGGCEDVVIENCRLENAGQRAIHAGGSTGRDYFRPPGARFEARDIVIRGNIIIGSQCAVAFTGVDGAKFAGNVVVRPEKWILRILQETRDEGFPPCRNVNFHHNVIVFERRSVGGEVNIGPGTAPETFRFRRNWWFAADEPGRSAPQLPTPEQEAVHGRDPRLDPRSLRPTEPDAVRLLGAAGSGR